MSVGFIEVDFGSAPDARVAQTPAYTTDRVIEFRFLTSGIARLRLVGAYGKNLGDYSYDPLWVWMRPYPPTDVPNTFNPASMAGWWLWSRNDTDRPWFRVPAGVNLYVYRPPPTWDGSISYFVECTFDPEAVPDCGGVR